MFAQAREYAATQEGLHLHQVETARIHDAFQVLNYNQQLIQFADSKAGNLIVINSLFIAASQAEKFHPGGWMVIQASYVWLACLAVLFCLSVITAKLEPTEVGRKDLIFFDDILTRRGSRHYLKEFREIQPQQQLDDILHRTHTLAGIAKRKFANFAMAQRLTVLAAASWVVANLCRFLV